MFFNEKIFDDDKFYLFDRFLESNQNFTTEHVEIVKIPFVRNSRFFKFFFLISQIPGFFFFALTVKFQVFPGKVATMLRS